MAGRFALPLSLFAAPWLAAAAADGAGPAPLEAWARLGESAPYLRAGATAAVLLLAAGLYLAVRRARFGGLEGRVSLRAARAGLVAAVFASAGAALAELWVGGAFSWLSTGPGAALAGRAIRLAIILVAAVAARDAIAASIERALRRVDSARAPCLPPPQRLAALSELGIDIAPLLASAGIVGLAIGFGSQSPVKDTITGIFILIGDSIKVGDAVEIAGHVGTVESMTVRLRDLAGDAHFMHFGEIASVRNMSRGFSYVMIQAGVAYAEDVDRVIAKLREVGDALCGDAFSAPTFSNRSRCRDLTRSAIPRSISTRASRPGLPANGISAASSTAA